MHGANLPELQHQRPLAARRPRRHDDTASTMARQTRTTKSGWDPFHSSLAPSGPTQFGQRQIGHDDPSPAARAARLVDDDLLACSPRTRLHRFKDTGACASRPVPCRYSSSTAEEARWPHPAPSSRLLGARPSDSWMTSRRTGHAPLQARSIGIGIGLVFQRVERSCLAAWTSRNESMTSGRRVGLVEVQSHHVQARAIARRAWSGSGRCTSAEMMPRSRLRIGDSSERAIDLAHGRFGHGTGWSPSADRPG
jgi:hypothetical protein